MSAFQLTENPNMITFKSPEDLNKLSPDDPSYPTVKEIISPYIDDPNYRSQDDGYVALIEPGDVDRVLSDLDMPWRLSEVPFEAVTMVNQCLHCLYSPNCQFDLSILAPDEEWLPDDVRQHLEAHI